MLTALLIAAGTLAGGLCLLVLTSTGGRGPSRATAVSGAIAQERSDALRHLSRDMQRETGSRARRDADAGSGRQ